MKEAVNQKFLTNKYLNVTFSFMTSTELNYCSNCQHALWEHRINKPDPHTGFSSCHHFRCECKRFKIKE